MSRAARAIVTAGLVCGVLDGIAAAAMSLYYGGTVIRTFQGIAAGLLGPAARNGGMAAAVLGLTMHFVVALGASAVYYAASRRLHQLIQHPVLCGVMYGIAVHLVMRFVVTPLSAIGWRPVVWKTFVILLLIHMVVVGPSLSLTIAHSKTTDS